MSLLSIALKGDLEQYMREEVDLKRRAYLYALQVGSQSLQQDLTAQTQPLGARLAKLWRAKVYPNGGTSPRALVYTKAPAIIESFMADTVILPKKGKYLAVPTDNNRRQGAGGGGAIISIKSAIQTGLAFTRPRKAGPGLILFLRVPRVPLKNRRATLVQLFGRNSYRAIRNAIGGGRHFARKQVPLFTLIPQVRHKKIIDGDAAAARLADRLPQFLAEGYAVNDTGSGA